MAALIYARQKPPDDTFVTRGVDVDFGSWLTLERPLAAFGMSEILWYRLTMAPPE
jgi:hypothetical protein